MSFHRFVSVKKSETRFNDFLWGCVEAGYRAIPVKTLSLGMDDETVTFEILPIDEVAKPSVFMFAIQFIKLNSFLLILVPYFVILAQNYSAQRLSDPFSYMLAGISAMFLFAGLMIRNDVVDHMTGFDRVNIAYNPKPILLGWITAKKASAISWAFIGVSTAISIPIFILQIEVFRILVIAIFLLLTTQFLNKNSYKQNWLGEFSLFMLGGPVLTSGYQTALGGGVNSPSIGFGILWGLAFLFLIHINNFSHIFTSSQANIKNSITRMGFDKAKRFITVWWVAVILVFFLYYWFYGNLVWTVVSVGVLLLGSLRFFTNLNKLNSPLGSKLKQVRKDAVRAFLILALLIVAENISQIGNELNWDF